MVTKFTVDGFKSLAHVECELGQVNVFIGANGSGKSNLLEALGVLSAAADGRVDDARLTERGVRPGLPNLYKVSLAGPQPRHLTFRAENAAADGSSSEAAYFVTLHNPLEDPRPAWQYKHEGWWQGLDKLVGRSPALKPRPNPEQGLAALKAVELAAAEPAMRLLRALQGYVIYACSTTVLRGGARAANA